MLIQDCSIRVSRWHVAEAAVKGAAVRNEKVKLDMHEILSGIRHELQKTREYIMATGKGEWRPPHVFRRPQSVNDPTEIYLFERIHHAAPCLKDYSIMTTC